MAAERAMFCTERCPACTLTSLSVTRKHSCEFLLLDEAVASMAVFVIVSGSDGRTETLLAPAK